MAISPAVLLSEIVPQGGELQVKRKPPWDWQGHAWEAIVWEPKRGGYPRAKFRVQAQTMPELFAKLEKLANGGDGDAVAAE